MAHEGNLKKEVIPPRVAKGGGISSLSCECVETEDDQLVERLKMLVGLLGNGLLELL